MKIKNTKIYKLYRNILRVEELNKRVYDMENKLQVQEEKILRVCQENYYANIFHDTIKNSKWFNIPLSLSNFAIGYPFAYILYRILDEVKPTNILELGLGQSTKIVTEYVKYFNKKDIKHHIVEHNKDWIKFFKENVTLLDNQQIHTLENYKKDFNGESINAYKNFNKTFKKEQFDLILVDGLIGHCQAYSRVDILEIIPSSLKKSFIILIDDYERIGEQNTVKLLEDKLKENNIAFHCSILYSGINTTYICVSEDLKFLCSI